MCVYIVPEEGEEVKKNAAPDVLIFWPNTRTVIDRKIVVSSADDGTSQPVCTHC